MNNGAIKRCMGVVKVASILHLFELSSKTSQLYKLLIICSLVVANPLYSALLTYSRFVVFMFFIFVLQFLS